MSQMLILTNGRFHTMDPRQPTATAVAIQNGKFLAVGDDDAMKSLARTNDQVLDMNGRCLTPGLVDAHVHFQGFSIYRKRVDLDGATSVDEALGRIRDYAAGKSDDSWLQGRGWSQSQWGSDRFPTADDLDRIIPKRPACFKHKSGHAAWVNSRALQIANITSTTADPPGGQIQRDATGQPTGILFEDAMNLVTNHIPSPTETEIVDAMRDAQTYCWQVGLTGIHDFDGRSCFRALQTLRANEELGLRFVKNIPVKRLGHAIGVGLRSGFGDNWLRIGGVKIFADGALGPRTAAMVAPYENEPDNYGIVVTDKEEMLAHALQASANGLSLTVHAIGDRANHDILDVYEIVRQEEKKQSALRDPQREKVDQPALRHRIEHVQILHANDLLRLGELNIIASMQPTHAPSDMIMADRNWGERARYSYAWRTMLDSGAVLAFGSDAPIEKIDPLQGIFAAVTRRRQDGAPGAKGWYPKQKLTMAETIHAFTMGTAVAAYQEKQQGSITPGKLADLTIYDQDIFTIPHDAVPDVTIAGTIVGGQLRHRTW